MQAVTTIGFGIAKSVFRVHGVDTRPSDYSPAVEAPAGRSVFPEAAGCLVSIEACASSHYWSRELQALGHNVRLMPPAYVRPYVKRQKNVPISRSGGCFRARNYVTSAELIISRLRF